MDSTARGRRLSFQDDVRRGVDARAESGRDEERGIVLVHHGGSVEAHPRGETVAVVAGRVHEADAAEIDSAPADERAMRLLARATGSGIGVPGDAPDE